MYPTCCIGGALGGGGGAEAYKLHLSKSQFRKSAQTHITTLPTNFSSTGELPVKIQPSLWYRALYWNDHTILTSLTDMWIRAYSPRAGWQEALAQPKNITSSPQAFLVTPGTAAGLTVLLVWCCKFYTNHHTALISMWVCIWYSQAEAALQVLVQATLLPTIQHMTDQQDLQKDQKDVNFSWLSCECQNVRNRLVALWSDILWQLLSQRMDPDPWS